MLPRSFRQKKNSSGDGRDAAGEEENVAEDGGWVLSGIFFDSFLVFGKSLFRQYEVGDEVLSFKLGNNN